MFKNKYYYIIAGLNDLILDQSKIALSLSDFKQELSEHLHKKDYELIVKIFLSADNKNLLNILEKSENEFDNTGKYDRTFMEQAVKNPDFDDKYLNKIVTAFKNETPIIENTSWEDQINSLYYNYLLASDNSFLKDYFTFNLNINNIIAAINARKHNIKNKNIFVGDNFVVDALKQSTLKDFGLSAEFPEIENIINLYEQDDILKREKDIDMLKWKYMDELNTFNYFTIEVIIAYVLKLQMVERWINLDKEKGKEMFSKLINNLNESFEFSKEFEIITRKRKLD